MSDVESREKVERTRLHVGFSCVRVGGWGGEAGNEAVCEYTQGTSDLQPVSRGTLQSLLNHYHSSPFCLLYALPHIGNQKEGLLC